MLFSLTEHTQISMQNVYLVQCVQIGITIVHIICIGWVENISPLLRCWHMFCWASFWFAFIIHQIQPNNLKNIRQMIIIAASSAFKKTNMMQIVPFKIGEIVFSKKLGK
jgi:hypothetical protein